MYNVNIEDIEDAENTTFKLQQTGFRQRFGTEQYKFIMQKSTYFFKDKNIAGHYTGRTRMSRRRRIAILWAVVVCVAAAAVILATSLTVAYYSSLNKGWAQQAAIAGVSFRLNGEEVGKSSSYSPVLLYRGDEAILNLETDVRGSATGTTEVQYAIYFELFTEESGDHTQRTQITETNGIYSGALCDGTTMPEFARAIEVYEYVGGTVVTSEKTPEETTADSFDAGDYETVSVSDGTSSIAESYAVKTLGGEYKFVGMLDKLLTSSPAFTVSGNLGCGDTDVSTYKLIYSAVAGESFESIRTPFYLRVTAVPKIVRNSGNYYALSESDLKSVSQSANNADIYGKTIRLIGDITLTESLSYKNIGFDLNGHTLTLGANSISISYDGDYSASAFAVKGESAKLTGEGKISIDSGASAVYIDDNLASSSNINVTSFGAEALKNAIQTQLDEIGAEQIYPSVYDGADNTVSNIDITRDLKWYFAGNNRAAMTVNYVDGDNLTVTDGIFDVTHGLMTEVRNIGFTVTYSSALQGGSGEITVVGTSSKAVADYYVSTLPQTLDCSVFLPVYDAVTKTRLTWITSDAKYLTKDGIYIAGGYNALTGYGAWIDREIRVGVIAETDGERDYEEKNVKIIVLTPEERTAIIFDRIPSSLYKSMTTRDLDDRPAEDFLAKHINKDDALKAGLVGLSVTVDTRQEQTNLNYKNGSSFYVTVDNSVATTAENEPTLFNYLSEKPYICLANQLTTSSVLPIPAEVSFTYCDHPSFDANNAEIPSYSVDTTVTVIGDKNVTDLNDITDELQIAFGDNSYVNFTGSSDYRDKFYVKGISDDGAVINYELTSNAYADYIDIVNGIFVPDTENGTYIHYTENNHNDFIYVGKTGEDCYIKGSDITTIITKSKYDALDETNQMGYSPLPSTINLTDYDRYDRRSQIYIKNAYVPPYDHTAYLNAYIVDETAMKTNGASYTYTEDVNGYYDNDSSTLNCYTTTPHVQQPDLSTVAFNNGWYYITETLNGQLQRVFYEMSLAVTGIYHNGVEIPDSNLYLSMLDACNSNGDLFISTKEAQKTMANMSGTVTSGTYTYLDLSGKNIADITGLQYFTNVTGYDFHNNSIIGLDSLADVRGLTYLDFKDNFITDISPLSLLDRLEYLDLSNTDSNNSRNIITDLEPLRYLANIKNLNLKYNNGITTLEPISEYTNLDYLNIMQADGSSPLQKLDNNRYYCVLINSRCDPVTIKMNSGTSETSFPSDTTKTNEALALSELKLIDETYNTLFLPTEYNYNGTVYQLFYESDNSDIVMNNSVSNNTRGYTITTPIVDQKVTITVKIAQSGTIESTFYRAFELDLLRLNTADPVLLRDDSDNLYRAETAIPDTALRAALFSVFSDNITAETVTFDGTNGSYQILDTGAISTDKELLRVSAGIKSLEGLQYFHYDISKLDLSGNIIDTGADGFPDITPISKLDSLTELTLSGQKYDFSQLLTDNNGTFSGLANLTKLDVSGCYGLDEEYYNSPSDFGVLNSLYMVYLYSTSVNIYKDSTSDIWDPYAIPLAMYMKALPSAFVFSEKFNDSATKINDKYNGNMFLTSDGIKRAYVTQINGKYFYTFNFYGIKDVAFEIAKGSGSPESINGNGTNVIVGTDTRNKNLERYQLDATGIHMSSPVAYSDTDYVKLTLYGDDGTGRAKISGIHYVELKLEFNRNYKIIIDGVSYPLDEIFPGRDLRMLVLNYYSTQNISTYTYSNGTEGEIPAPIPISTIANTISLTTTGSYLQTGESDIQGLQYTNIDKLTIERDAYFGNGEWLENVESLTVYYSAVDFGTLTKDHMLTKLNTLKIGTSTQANVFAKLYDDSLRTELADYITALESASVNGISVFSSGTFPTAAQIDELREIVRQTDSEGEYKFYLNYMPNLTKFESYISNIYDWRFLLGLLYSADTVTNENTGKFDSNSLANLTIYRINKTSDNVNANSDVTEAIVRQLYYNHSGNKNYYIGVKYMADDADGKKATQSKELYNPDTWHRFINRADPNLTVCVTDSTIPTDPISSNNYRKYYATAVEAGEFKEFAENIPDLGVYINVTGTPSNNTEPPTGQTNVTADRYIESDTAIVEQGSVIYLPHTMEDTGFFYTPGSTEYDFYRNAVITWTLDDNFSDDNSINLPSSEYYTIGSSYADGTMLVFKGVLSNSGVSYSFIYPLTVQSSSTSAAAYSLITDPHLRFAVFCRLGRVNVMTNTVTTLNFNETYTSLYSEFYNDYTAGIRTLAGLNQFTSLSTLTLTNSYVNDISALSSLTALTTLNLSGNLIADVSALSSCTSLVTLDLSDNKIREIPSGWSTNLAALSSLNLNGNGLISGGDIANIANSLTSGCALSTLKIYGTRAAGNYTTGVCTTDNGVRTAVDTISALSKILEMNNGDSLTYTAASASTSREITVATISDLNAYMSGSNNSEFNKLVYSKNFYEAFSFENCYQNGCTNISFLDRNVYDPNRSGNKSAAKEAGMTTIDTTIKVTFGYSTSDDLFVYKKIDDLILTTSTQSTVVFALSGGTASSVYNKTDFDPALFTYIITQMNASINGSRFTVPYSAARTINIDSECGFASLKGIKLIPGDINVTITDNKLFNSLDIGTAVNGSSVKSITLDGIAIDEGGMSTLANCAALTTLDLRGATGINYLLVETSASPSPAEEDNGLLGEISVETTAEETTTEETTVEETTAEETTAEETTVEETTAEETTTEELIVLETLGSDGESYNSDKFQSEPKRGLLDALKNLFGLNDEEETEAVTEAETEAVTEAETEAVTEAVTEEQPEEPTIMFSYMGISGSDNLAQIIDGLTALTSLKINNEYNYYGVYNVGEYLNDLAYYDSDSNALNAVSAISFGTVTAANADFTHVYGTGADDLTHSYITRSRSAKLTANEQWWTNNAITSNLYGDNINLFNVVDSASDFNFGNDVTSLTQNMTALVNYISAFNKDEGSRREIVVGQTENGSLKDWLYYTDIGLTATDDNNVAWNGITFFLPTSFKLFGEDVQITWTAAYDSDDVSSTCSNYVENLLLTNSGNATDGYIKKFCLYDANNALDFKYLDTIALNASAVFNGSTYNISKVFTIFRSYDYLAVEETGLSDSGDYYLELTTGVLTPASEVFISRRLIDWLFTKTDANNGMYVGSTEITAPSNVAGSFTRAGTGEAVTSGKYFSKATIDSVTKLNINNASNSIGALSFEGLQIFTNLNDLTIAKGYPVSLEPFSDMKLEKFEYTCSNAESTNNIIQDFSPLYNSRDTLTSFKYGSSGFHHVDDMSFLLSFPNLKVIEIDSGSNYYTGISEMPWLHYMAAVMLARNNATANTDDNVKLTVNKEVIVNNDGSYKQTILTPELRRAAEILGELEGGHEFGVDYRNEFELVLNGNAVNSDPDNDEVNNVWTASLPSSINIGGELFPLEWITLSSFIDISASPVSADEEGYFTNGASRSWTMTITDKTDNFLNQAYIICRVMHKGSYYDRILVFDCRESTEYQIRYNYADDSTAAITTDMLKPYKILNLETPTYTGHHFLGWYTVENAGGISLGTMMTQKKYMTVKNLLIDVDGVPTLDIYAGWRAYYDYTVNLNLNGGSTITDSGWTLSGNIYSATGNTGGSDLTLPTNAQRQGYTFNGWYTSPSFGTRVTESDYDWRDSSAAVTYYAHWLPNYTLILNTNGGIFTTASDEGYSSVTGGYSQSNLSPLATVTLPSDITQSGYVFVGWYTNSAYSGQPVTEVNSDTVGSLTVVNLYAKWRTAYSVTLNLVGGSQKTDQTYFTDWTEITDSDSNITGYTISNVSPLTAFTLPNGSVIGKTGYSFDGWYDNAAYTGDAVTQIEADNTANVTLYAKWDVSVVKYYVVISQVNNVTAEYNKTFTYYTPDNNIREYSNFNNCAYELVNDNNGNYIARNVPKNEGATFKIYKFDNDVYTSISGLTGTIFTEADSVYSIQGTTASNNSSYNFGSFNFSYTPPADGTGSGALTVTRPVFTYTLVGSNNSGTAHYMGTWPLIYSASAPSGGNWVKPNINYIFNYDAEYGFYYIDFSSTKTGSFKIAGVKSDSLYSFNSMGSANEIYNGSTGSDLFYWLGIPSGSSSIDASVKTDENGNITLYSSDSQYGASASGNIPANLNGTYRIYLDPTGGLSAKLNTYLGNTTTYNNYVAWLPTP